MVAKVQEERKVKEESAGATLSGPGTEVRPLSG